MTRISLLAQNRPTELIRRIAAFNTELKSRQQQTGKGGLLGYLTQTSASWDLNEGLSGGETVEIEIVFAGDGTQRYPVMQPYVDIFFGGTAESNRPNDVTGSWTDGLNGAVLGDYLKFDTAYSASDYEYRWTIVFGSFGTLDYYLKAYAVGSSPGTITVTRVF